MFVRRKKNCSGSTSVVVADKSSGTFTELKVIGVGITEDEIRFLVKKGKEWISHYAGQQTITFPDEKSKRLKREEDAMTEHIYPIWSGLPWNRLRQSSTKFTAGSVSMPLRMRNRAIRWCPGYALL